MIVAPSFHALAAIVFTIMVFIAFANSRIKIEIVSLMAIGLIALGLYAYPFPGHDRKDGLELAFAGFGHPALITICSLMIMGRGLVVTGSLNPFARLLARVWRVNLWVGLLVTLVMAMGLSMIVNDTPVLVLLIPVMVTIAATGGMPTSKTLMPLNAAILIGGMGTTIGTSTNLLVVALASDLGMPALGIFHFTPLVLTAAAIAFPYIWLVMPRLMPDNSREAGHEPRRFATMFRLGEKSALLGQTLDQLRGAVPALAIDSAGTAPLTIDSRISAVGPLAAIEAGAHSVGATPYPRWLGERLHRRSNREHEDLIEAELAVTRDSRLIGETLDSAAIGDIAVSGVSHVTDFRDHRPFRADAPLAEGDVLAVIGLPDEIQRFAQRDGLLVLEGIRELPRSTKAPLALAIMGVAVLVASLGLLPIAISSLGGATAMLLTRCVRFDRVGRALSAKVIVLVAASLAIGQVMLESGAADWLALLFALGLVYLPAWGVVAAIMTFVTLLTNFASNATAAAVGTPIAFSLARQLDLPVEPLVLAVLFGCNLCYATPIAYQTNMLIMTEGDYKFADYLRGGVPLVLIMITALAFLLARQYSM